jgi:hypothetical protein
MKYLLLVLLLTVSCTSAPPKYRYGQHFMEKDEFHGECLGTIDAFSVDWVFGKEWRTYSAGFECRSGFKGRAYRQERTISAITDIEYENIRCDWGRWQQPKKECK